MQIKSKETIKDLKGEAIPNGDEKFTVGEALANILLEAPEGGKMKLFLLAQSLYKDKTVEVDKVDLELIKKAVETTSKYNNLVTGQLLVLLS